MEEPEPGEIVADKAEAHFEDLVRDRTEEVDGDALRPLTGPGTATSTSATTATNAMDSHPCPRCEKSFKTANLLAKHM